MRLALRLARRAYGQTSPNPMVGALLVRNGRIIGRGWHHRAGEPHAEVEAIRHARFHGRDTKGATLYVTLEPCSTFGRTPPCTDAIQAAGIQRVVAAATDPNPLHAGRGFRILRRAGIEVVHGILAEEAHRLNEAFHHWTVHRTPFVTVKTALTLDGKIATASGESKWITGRNARAYAMKLRQGADAILVGINTIMADNPALTWRSLRPPPFALPDHSRPRRVVLDTRARTPLNAKIVNDRHAGLTTIVVGRSAPGKRVAALSRRVNVWVAPTLATSGLPAAPRPRAGEPPPSVQIDLRWLLHRLGAESVTSLLVEGGGEVSASFLLGGFAQRVAFFFAPKILGGRDARKAVAGQGVRRPQEVIQLREVTWRRLEPDLLLTALVAAR